MQKEPRFLFGHLLLHSVCVMGKARPVAQSTGDERPLEMSQPGCVLYVMHVYMCPKRRYLPFIAFILGQWNVANTFFESVSAFLFCFVLFVLVFSFHV